MLKSLLNSPATAFAATALVAFFSVALAAFALSWLPQTSFHVVPAPGDRLQVQGVGTYPAERQVRFIDHLGRERLVVPLHMLVVTKDARGTPSRNRAMYHTRDRITRLVMEPGMQLRLPDGRMLAAQAFLGRLWQLTSGAWIVLATGLGAMLAGLWAVVLRPREWGARMFLLSAIGLLLATITIASNEQRSLAVSAAYQFWENQLNYLSAHMFGLSLVALFARYPFPLISRRGLALLAGVTALFWLIGLFDLWTDVFAIHLMLVLAWGMGTIALAMVQGWKSRHDPALRMSFVLIGSSLLICIGVFSAVNMVPQLLGAGNFAPLPVTTAGFLLFYLALAVAIARYRLFDLGAWAVHVAIAALVVIGVLIVDFVLVLVAGGSWTLSLAFLAAAIIWLPLRELLLRRSDRRRGRHDHLLLRGANEVAFASRPGQQASLWQKLLESQFLPLNSEPCDCDTVEIRADGRTLEVPSPLDGQGIALHFSAQGRRLFSSEDKAVAEALIGLVREMSEARQSYDRGVRAERERIARDLHDDVGARLMTTLHRDDLDIVHADVREAMADMRLIIDGMSGQARRLSDSLADLRHETVNRLALAHIRTTWPIGPAFEDERLVDVQPNRVLVSVVRELTSNIIRHSGASNVTVNAMLDADCLMLSMADDGRGFSSGQEESSGNGLINTRKRITELGGTIAVESRADGLTVQLRLPLVSPDQGIATVRRGP